MIALAVAVLVLWVLIVASVRRTRTRLLLIALPIVVPCAVASPYIFKSMLIPVETAEVDVSDLNASIRLELYGADWSDDDGRRYLVVKGASGEVRHSMSPIDWVHWPRTSIYLMGDGRIAVLGPAYDDYVVDPKRETVGTLKQGTASDSWTYFGAFDFRDKKLKFIPASEQRECTPTMKTEAYTWVTRAGGRFDRCRQEALGN